MAEKATRRPGRPPRGTVPRGRGRPRKHPAPDQLAPSAAVNAAQFLQNTSSVALSTSPIRPVAIQSTPKAPAAKTNFVDNLSPSPQASVYQPAKPQTTSISSHISTSYTSNDSFGANTSSQKTQTVTAPPYSSTPPPPARSSVYSLTSSSTIDLQAGYQHPPSIVPIGEYSSPASRRSQLLHSTPLSHFSGPAKHWFSPNMFETLPSAGGDSSSVSHSSAQADSSSSLPHPTPAEIAASLSRMKFTTQPTQVLECKSGVVSMALSPCGTMLACGTLLGQIYIYSAETISSSSSTAGAQSSTAKTANDFLEADSQGSSAAFPEDHVRLSAWNNIKWAFVAVLHDYNETFVDEFWNLIWTPESTHIIAAGACKSRKEFDLQDNDLKVLETPIVVFNLLEHLDAPSSVDASGIPLPKLRKAGIARYAGHEEEIMSMKLWKLETTPNGDPEYLLFTSSQDGHIRKWKFDKSWNRLESTVQLQDEETWMAFSLALLQFPPQPHPPTDSSGSPPSKAKLTPRPLLLLAGDRTLKLFDPVTNAKLFTFEDVYREYCTSVEVFTSSTGIEHPRREGVFLNGDGRVFYDAACTKPIPDEPPTFLILTKGIDFQAHRAPKAGGDIGFNPYDDPELGEDMEEYAKQSNPTRVLLHALTIPIQHQTSMVPSMRGGVRRTETCHRFTVEASRLTLESLYLFSHPLLNCNYWPSRLTHNGRSALIVSTGGTIFAWVIPRTPPENARPAPTHKPKASSAVAASSFASSTQASSHPSHLPLSSSYSSKAPKPKPITSSQTLTAVFASHDEDLPVRDVLFHPYWPFMFTASDDGSVHVLAPTMIDPAKNCAVLLPGRETPTGACLSSVLMPRGSNNTLVQPIATTIGPTTGSGTAAQQQGSAYRSAVEAAMIASVGALMPAVAKRKRGRPPKKKLIEDIEAQFAAQERALAKQQQEQLLQQQQQQQQQESQAKTEEEFQRQPIQHDYIPQMPEEDQQTQNTFQAVSAASMPQQLQTHPTTSSGQSSAPYNSVPSDTNPSSASSMQF